MLARKIWPIVCLFFAPYCLPIITAVPYNMDQANKNTELIVFEIKAQDATALVPNLAINAMLIKPFNACKIREPTKGIEVFMVGFMKGNFL